MLLQYERHEGRGRNAVMFGLTENVDSGYGFSSYQCSSYKYAHSSCVRLHITLEMDREWSVGLVGCS